MPIKLFTPEEDRQIAYLREDRLLKWVEIARIVGRPSGWCVCHRYRRLKDRQDDMPRPQPRTRPCMGCRTSFHSPHFGVRFCDPCRSGLDDGPMACVSVGRGRQALVFGGDDSVGMRATYAA